MCGIAGIIQGIPGSFNKQHLSDMTSSLAHRGPDGVAYWQNIKQNALLGHCRLAVIDLTNAAAQPMHYMGRYTIIHNGEIYNYIELREQLVGKGYSFSTSSDTEVICAAYDHFEDECVEHFNGMFAFAIWDEQEQEFFAARDRFGEKPFYYCLNDDTLFFASELKALWAASVQRRPNLQMLFNFITIGYTDNPGRPEETFFENVYRLPAASLLYFHPATKELTIEKYWDIDPGLKNKLISDVTAMERFNDLFSNSIRRRLRSDVGIGTSLSGGLDSSSVVAVISELIKNTATKQPKDSFTAIFPGFEKDEAAFAEEVSSQFNLRSHVVAITADDLVNDWEKFIYHQEEPFATASAYAQFKVYELAKKENIKVLLDGQGADETLAGYPRYYKWYWQELFQKRRLVSSRELKAAKELGVEETFGLKNIVAALVPDIASVILERQYLVNALRHEDLTRDFVRLQSKEAYYSTPATFNLNGALYFNTFIHGLEELLRLADRNSMAHGREVRLPFLDHELVEFVFSLPSHFKIRQGWTKWILRNSMAGKLPVDIVWRKRKVGFEPPQKDWMQDPRVQEMIHQAKQKLVREKILNPRVLDRPVIAGSSHGAGGNDWRYLTAAAWL